MLSELDGKLWHATTEASWRGIVADGVVRCDAPAVHRNGFCRSIGGISLFDLEQLDAVIPTGATHWSAWLGRMDDEPRYWIEIDRAAVAGSLLSPAETLARWRVALAQKSQALRIISGIEVAHLGPIPLAKTKQVIRLVRGRRRDGG